MSSERKPVLGERAARGWALALAVVGLVLVLRALVGWTREPRVEERHDGGAPPSLAAVRGAPGIVSGSGSV